MATLERRNIPGEGWQTVALGASDSLPSWWTVDNTPGAEKVQFDGDVVTGAGVFTSDGVFQRHATEPYDLPALTAAADVGYDPIRYPVEIFVESSVTREWWDYYYGEGELDGLPSSGPYVIAPEISEAYGKYLFFPITAVAPFDPGTTDARIVTADSVAVRINGDALEGGTGYGVRPVLGRVCLQPRRAGKYRLDLRDVQRGRRVRSQYIRG